MFRHLVIALVICCLPQSGAAHPGGVDENGCHKESRTGERHCHPDRAKHSKRKPTYDDKHPPKPGDEWRFNVYRIKRPKGPTRPNDDAVYNAWSPTGGPSFHVPAAFGVMAFGG